jgi:hypothetical protein
MPHQEDVVTGCKPLGHLPDGKSYGVGGHDAQWTPRSLISQPSLKPWGGADWATSRGLTDGEAILDITAGKAAGLLRQTRANFVQRKHQHQRASRGRSKAMSQVEFCGTFMKCVNQKRCDTGYLCRLCRPTYRIRQEPTADTLAGSLSPNSQATKEHHRDRVRHVFSHAGYDIVTCDCSGGEAMITNHHIMLAHNIRPRRTTRLICKRAALQPLVEGRLATIEASKNMIVVQFFRFADWPSDSR